MIQLDLFAWAESKPSNIIDIMPALIRKVALEPIAAPKGEGKVVKLEREVA
ncbi:hypothetical protein [Sinorhizobium fredii]|uniref:hypothetical protein n=1 Tax=Rhizobium fredii TaxID=380 RepID=UPI00351156A2